MKDWMAAWHTRYSRPSAVVPSVAFEPPRPALFWALLCVLMTGSCSSLSSADPDAPADAASALTDDAHLTGADAADVKSAPIPCEEDANCGDGNDCTVDSCDEGVCHYSNATDACDDGNPCTRDDVCSGGSCHGVQPVCGNGVCECSETSGACAGDCPTTPGMVTLPAGEFLMGSPTGVGAADEHPQHQVTLSAFQIDRTEVTAGQYDVFYRTWDASHQCATSNGGGFLCVAPQNNGNGNWGVIGRENYPVNLVDWFQAQAYCLWAHPNGRLPTEAEWEYAARSGGQPQAYPWGETSPTCDLAVMPECLATQSAPVCSTPAGNSSAGACDLAGNVAEWVGDFYAPYAAATQVNPTGPLSNSSGGIVRGGSVANDLGVRAELRIGPLSLATRAINVGFRCVRSL